MGVGLVRTSSARKIDFGCVIFATTTERSNLEAMCFTIAKEKSHFARVRRKFDAACSVTKVPS